MNNYSTFIPGSHLSLNQSHIYNVCNTHGVVMVMIVW